MYAKSPVLSFWANRVWISGSNRPWVSVLALLWPTPTRGKWFHHNEPQFSQCPHTQNRANNLRNWDAMYQILNPRPRTYQYINKWRKKSCYFCVVISSTGGYWLPCSRHCSRCWDAAGQARSPLPSDVSSSTEQRQKDCSGPQLARVPAPADEGYPSCSSLLSFK